MAVSRINEAGLNVNQYGNRNLVINGGMQVAQRGNFTITTSGSAEYGGPDRFFMWSYTSTEQVVADISQATDVPSGQGFSSSYKVDVTTAESAVAAGEALLISQYIEAQNAQQLEYGTSSAKNVTVSFWIKSTKTGTYCFSLNQPDANRVYVKEYTVDASNTWEKKIITIPGDASGTINNDNGRGPWLQWVLMAGSSRQGTANNWRGDPFDLATSNQVNAVDNASNNIYLTGVQLEVGDTATDFEHRTFDDEYRKCLRYYERWDFPDTGDYSTVLMYNESTDQARGPLNCTVYKRANPAFSATASSWGAISTGSSGTAVSISATNLKPWGCRIEITKSNSTLIDGGAAYLRCLNSGAHIALDAEL